MVSSGIGVSQYTVLTLPIRRALELLADTGIAGLELFMEGTQWWDGDATQQAEAMGARFAGPLSVHPPAWDINIASYTRPVREMSIGVYGQAIEWARRVGATYIVVHVGWRADPSFPRTECLARAEEAIRILSARAAAAGVRLAVENVGWAGQEICNQEEFTALIHRLPPGAGALLDVGHALLAGWDLPAALRDLAPRMVALHLHDNDGRTDLHLPIGEGRIDWVPLMRRLSAMPAGCQYILEYAPGTPLERVLEGREILSRALGAG